MAKNGMENIQAHVAEHAAYGGHNGHGGIQRPKPSKTKGGSSGTILHAGTPTVHNKVPMTGPATRAGALAGPVGTGSIGGK